MACLLCRSERQSVFNAELALSYPGLKGMMKNPPIYMVSKTNICLDCGFVDLRVPHGQLELLREGEAALEPPGKFSTAQFRAARG